jgi:Contractile injection system tube protein
MSGPLLKLTMIPLGNADTGPISPPNGPPFIAQMNPETYTDAVEFGWDSQDPTKGDTSKPAKFDWVKPKKFSFELLLDGTGASPEPLGIGFLPVPPPPIPPQGLGVVAQLELFKLTVGFRNEDHKPNYVLLLWGRLVAVAAIESYSVAYKMFAPSGLPIRASLSATFREHVHPKLLAAMKNLASPDIEHGHVMTGSDHLSRVVHGVYRSTRHIVDVAQANGLDTIRKVAVGREVYLPPLE